MNAGGPGCEQVRLGSNSWFADQPEVTAAGEGLTGFRACVHRGTRQIGGTCVELECRGSRILLDLGLPLDADPFADDPAALLPDVVGLRSPDPGLLAVVISHGHADHWGLIPYAHPSLPIVMGAATLRILRAAALFGSR